MRLFGIPLPSPRKHGWLRAILPVLGLVLLTVAVWWGAPMTGWPPAARVDLRLAVILPFWLIWLAVVIIRWRRRVRAARALEEALVQPEPQGDGKVLTEKMEAALATLRKSGGASYLYELPWYVIIGPPGAGKTTALVNSGIEFPLKQAEPVQGFGGTRDTDFWFAEDAVLIDTAGRYVTQDSDAVTDKASWESFLGLLKRHRPNQPVNGVILAFSVADMLNADSASLNRHAEIVRARLAEIHQTLKVDFPVYVMFTKADLIAGFREYFASFSQSRRKLVWGTTFQTTDRKAITHEAVPQEFDRLVARLSDEVIDRLAEESDGISRIAIFNLPGQMALLRDNVAEFLRLVFMPTRFKTNAILRGFYFTSGTQEGTPIDQVLGALNPVGGAGGITPAFMSGRGKSFFIHDLLKRVIFAESGWVSHDRRAVRRAFLLRSVAVSAVLLGTAGALAALGWSAWQNHRLVRTTQTETLQYVADASTEMGRDEIDDPDLRTVEQLLNKLSGMDVGYASSRQQGWDEGLGLGQRDLLHAGATDAYANALERMLRPRLILDLEERLPQIIESGNTPETYRALKVYLLVTKAYLSFADQGARPDDTAVQQWFEAEWRQQYNASGADVTLRANLSRHLAAMLVLGRPHDPLVAWDPSLVERAQQAIAQLPLDEQAWTLMLDGAEAAGLRPWGLLSNVGAGGEQVFATRDGSDLSALSVPGVFTYEGFWVYFFNELTLVGDRLRADQWVLGDLGRSEEVEARLRRLDRDLLDRYRIEFARAWRGMLGNLTLTSLVADRPQYQTLNVLALAQGKSPLFVLVQAVDRETRLNAEYKDISPDDMAALMAGGASDGGDVAAGVAGDVGGALAQRMRSRQSGAQRILLDAMLSNAPAVPGSVPRPGGAQPGESLLRPIDELSADFQNWHELMLGEVGQRPIDALLGNLGEIWATLHQAERAPDIAAQMMPTLLANLSRNNSQLPPELRGLIERAESDFRMGEADASIEAMNRDLVPITQFCRETIAPARPFGAGPRSLSIDNFAQFFKPGGMMDAYFTKYLDPLVERGPDGMTWRADRPAAQRLSSNTLLQFQRAERIRQAFFAGGGEMPLVDITVAQTRAHPDVETAILAINGTVVRTATGLLSHTIEWPGRGRETLLELLPARDGVNSTLRFDGSSWTFIDFLASASSVSVQGDKTTATFSAGGRWVTYDFTINAITNPFTMRELRQFECPTSID
ncbi:MAG: type VI secretion system membrane subunit TssM [Paracoccus sp. (in: a-proteobacteria)]|nr:type VI secretion system membrane subunit TssM [Paracoccus sp. (in: a-proteobacteria)]